MLWENLREEEFEGAIKRSGGLCVMVLGCLEKHGREPTELPSPMESRIRSAEAP